MGWGNSQRRRGAAPRYYKLPPPGPGLLIRQTGVAYGDGHAEEPTVTTIRVHSLDGEPLREMANVPAPLGREDAIAVVRIPDPPPDADPDEYYANVRQRLERGVHTTDGFFHLEEATGDPHAPIGGDVLLTRADRQRYKIPIYNLTTGQPLLDIKGEGNLALNFDNSAFHSLFPDAELAIVRIPKPPDRASPEEAAGHKARVQELVEQGIEIDGKRYYLVLATGARKHGDFLFAHTPYWKKIAPTRRPE